MENDTIPPITIPNVAINIINRAFELSFFNASKFDDSKSNINEHGSKKVLIQSYRTDDCGSIPSVVENIGRKYIQIAVGKYLKNPENLGLELR